MDMVPWPVELKKNDILGRYFTASREVDPDEILVEDTAILSFPWSIDKSIVICLTCYDKLDLTSCSQCTKCSWPVCNSKCENGNEHADFECKILEKNRVQFSQTDRRFAYHCIQALRCLLLRLNSERKFQQLMDLEAHIQGRDGKLDIVEQIAYVVDFIQNKCNLGQYDEHTIKQVLGATEINTFMGPGENAHSCLVFPVMAMLAHDCTPNTKRVISKVENEDPGSSTLYCIKLTANQHINQGDVICISYGCVSSNVEDRRKRLKDQYFFDCECNRCKSEMREITR